MSEIDEIVTNIKNWNMENIHDLKSMIDELDDAVNEHNNNENTKGYTGCVVSDFLDFTSLPSVEIPAHHDYPIWAMDKNNQCLVGEGSFDIESYADIEKWYNEK